MFNLIVLIYSLVLYSEYCLNFFFSKYLRNLTPEYILIVFYKYYKYSKLQNNKYFLKTLSILNTFSSLQITRILRLLIIISIRNNVLKEHLVVYSKKI